MAEADPNVTALSSARNDKKHTPRWRKLVLMTSVPVILGIGAGAYYLANNHYVSTDNAYVQQDKVSVSAEVGGRIVQVAVKENQRVEAGDLLFSVDPQPFQIAVAQADAAISSAQAKVTGLETAYETTGSDIEAARQNLAFSLTEWKRQSDLLQSGFTTRARMDAADHTLSEARARLANAQADAAKARAALSTGSITSAVNPAVLAGRAQRQKASYDLARTIVRAPVSGIVSQSDRLHVGQMMVQGLPAVSIVAGNQSWIEANFKETDLNRMRVGQSAELTFDAYPGMRLKGHVASIGAGTGSEFSVLPAQNASGNWVKVTQRIPVRIAIDGTTDRPMIAGMSARVRIDTNSGRQ